MLALTLEVIGASALSAAFLRLMIHLISEVS